MNRESMAWLGAALFLKRYGVTDEQAAKLAGPLVEAYARPAVDKPGTEEKM